MIIDFMLLPHDLQHFPTPHLIIVADHVNARFYLVGGDAMEEIFSVGEPKERKSDKELNTEPSEEDGERVRRLAREIANAIKTFIHEKKADRFHLLMKDDLSHDVKNNLDAPARAAQGFSLPLDLANESPLDIVRRLVEKKS